jgi:copper chaperone CopZ
VTSALKTVDGIKVEDVQVGSASVAYDPAAVSPAQIAEAIENAGYETEPAGHVA